MVPLYGTEDVDGYAYGMAKKQLVKPRLKTVFRSRQFFRQWRKYRDMTLEQAAEIAGMTAGNLSAMERGTQGYTPEGLEGLSRAYKTSPGWLLEVNPLEEGDGFLTLYGRANASERQMIAEIAKTVIKTGK